MRDLAEALVDSLSESGRLVSAATVAESHLRDADAAVGFLSQAKEWREASRVAAAFDRQDLVETTIAPAAADVASSLVVCSAVLPYPRMSGIDIMHGLEEQTW